MRACNSTLVEGYSTSLLHAPDDWLALHSARVSSSRQSDWFLSLGPNTFEKLMRKVTNSVLFFENRLFDLFLDKFRWDFVRSWARRLRRLPLLFVKHKFYFLEFWFILGSTILVHEVLIFFTESACYECERKH